jgi:glyoxylase-like metal-dependent hydrolase (beta-lactamase superfamily II)
LDVGGSLVDGVRMIALPGHTPGHCGVLIEGAEQRLLFGGDAFNHPLQIADPDVPSGADADRAQAVVTRREVIALARRESLHVLGAHLPGARWP